MTKHSPKQTRDISVSPDELAAFERAAFQSLRKDLELPGFRRGRVPEDLARAHISRERIFAEAVEQAVATKGGEQIAGIAGVVGKPEVAILKAAPGNPLEFRLTFDVVPEISLERWRALRIQNKEVLVTDPDVHDALENIRRSRAKHHVVERAAQEGDVVEIDFSTTVDGKDVPGGSSQHHPITLGEGAFVPGFEEAIAGMSRGQEKTVRLPFPATWSQKELAGKRAEFFIKVHDVRERILPELDDAFAKTLGSFSNFEELRQSVREGLLEERRGAERRRVRTEAVEQIGKGLHESEIPEILIAQEIERMKAEFRESIERHGMSFEEYLARLGKKEEEFGKDWRAGAVKRVKAALVLRAVAKKEEVTVEPERVEERVQQILKQFREEAAAGNIDPEAVRSYTENVLRNEKTLDLIEEVVTANSSPRTSHP